MINKASFRRINIADRPVCPLYLDTPRAAAQGLLTHFDGYSDDPQDYVRFAASTVVVSSSYHLNKNQLIRSPVFDSNGFFIGDSCDKNGLYLSDDTFEVEQSTVGVKWNRDLISVLSPAWIDPTKKCQAKQK